MWERKYKSAADFEADKPSVSSGSVDASLLETGRAAASTIAEAVHVEGEDIAVSIQGHEDDAGRGWMTVTVSHAAPSPAKG